MAISTITSAGIATDTLVAGDIAADAVGSSEIAADAVGSSEIAADAVGISELAAVTGITADYHKVPTFANDSARDTAISSPTVGMLIYNTNSGAVQQYNGTWSTIAPAPNVTAVSGFLNDDSDSTITVFGSNFSASSAVKMFSASSGGSQIGSNATTTFNSSSKLTAVFGAGSIGASGSTAYIEVDNVGATNRFATAITVNADPTVVHAGATGTSANTTTHLGTYGGVGAGGPTDSNTKLLLNFDRGGGRDFEDSSNTGGDGHKTTPAGGVFLEASPFGDGKTAMKFAGTDGDDVTVTSMDAFSSGDFTIEFWARVDELDGDTHNPMIFDGGDASDTNGFLIQYDRSNGQMKVYNRTTAVAGDILAFSADRVIKVKEWTHIAVVRNSGTLTMYLNGRNSGSAANATNFTSTIFTLGRRRGGNNYNVVGYIDEVRVVIGSAVYTGNFTVPTARFSGSGQSAGAAGSNIAAVTAAQTKLLIHSNLSTGGSGVATFTDSATTGTTHTITPTGCFHSTLHASHVEGTGSNLITPAMAWPASGKTFGSTGVYFDGTGDYLTVPDHADWDLSSSWTLDMWVYPTDLGTGFNSVFQVGTDTANGFVLDMSSGGSTPRFLYYAGSWLTLSSSATISNGTWTHLSVGWDGSTYRIFVGGTQTGSASSSTAITNPAAVMQIGRATVSGSVHRYFTGYIDSLRFSTSARWTSAFTPPTTIYTKTIGSVVIPTITFTGSATQLAGDEDIEFTAVENTTKADGSRSFIDTDIGLTLTNLTGADKSKATLTGTLTSAESTTHTNMPLKLQVRKTLATAAYADASRVVTFSGSETTAGLAPAMPVTGTGIPASTTITTVDTTTTITLSANPTGGTLTGQSLVFLDLTRVSHQYNGSDILATGDAMYTLATGASSGPVLFNARRYIGTGAARSLTGFGFSPDLVWFKRRTVAANHYINDSVRGTGSGNVLYADTNAAAGTDAQSTQAHLSDGIRVGNTGEANPNNSEMIAWAWKAGGAPTADAKRRENDSSTEISLTAGSISDTTYDIDISAVRQSVNTLGDFSITKYTADPAGNNTHLCHGLSGIPDMVIVKGLGTNPWVVWHSSLADTTDDYLVLDTTAGVTNHAQIWQNAGPTATSMKFGAHSYTNTTTSIMYAWKAVAGVSAFGTYSGQISSAPTSSSAAGYCGFQPKFVIIKRTEIAQSWMQYDGFRNSGTDWTTFFNPQANNVEETQAARSVIVSANGFQTDDHANIGTSGGTYIFMAFA